MTSLEQWQIPWAMRIMPLTEEAYQFSVTVLSLNTFLSEATHLHECVSGNGPGFQKLNTSGAGNWTNIDRFPLGDDEAADFSYLQPSGQPIKSETHGGDDVGIWAVGPMSHLFHSTHEQSYIAHVMSYSACIGPHAHLGRCEGNKRSSAVSHKTFLVVLLGQVCL